MTLVKRALITGASSGIGKALCQLLAEKGIELLITARNQELLEAVKCDVNPYKSVIVDLSDKNQRGILTSMIREYLPDLVINNAGFGIYGDALTIKVEDQLKILEVNAAAALELTLEAARALVAANKEGIILNVSSAAGEFPCPGMSVYGGAKAFLTHVSQALNWELSSKGVHVLVSCPGMIMTDFASRAARKQICVTKGPRLTARFAAEQIWKQITTKKKKHIFNWQYRVGCWIASHLLPISFLEKNIWNQIKQRM